MAMQTQTMDQKILNTGATQHLIPFPAAGREWLLTRTGDGITASVADELGKPTDAIPFSRALGSLRVDWAQTKDQATIWAGPLQYVMPWPAEGRRIRTTAEGAVLVVTVADELGRAQDALPFTAAFRRLTLDPVLDPACPFQPYDPGFVYRR